MFPRRTSPSLVLPAAKKNHKRTLKLTQSLNLLLLLQWLPMDAECAHPNWPEAGAQSLLLAQASPQTTTTSPPPPTTTLAPVELPDFSEPIGNQTVALGRDAQLACKINKLGNFRSAWLRVEDKGILTIHNNIITRNYRFGLINDEQNRNFVLTIKNVQASDRGGYMCQINSVPMKYAVGYLDVLTPPAFEEEGSASGGGQESKTVVTVSEGSNASLSCRATGHPAPLITWRREDNEPILFNGNAPGEQTNLKFEGPALQLSQVSKLNSGAYLCIASNGVQPAASRRQLLDVQYAPIVRLPEREMLGQLGQSAKLVCVVEANPIGSFHWLKVASESLPADELSLIEREELLNSDKFEIVIKHISSEKVEMVLNLRQLERHDFAWYRCLARNSLGLQSGSIRLLEGNFLNDMFNRALGGGQRPADSSVVLAGQQESQLNDQAADGGQHTSGRPATPSQPSGGGARQPASSRAQTRSSRLNGRPEQSSRALLSLQEQSSAGSRAPLLSPVCIIIAALLAQAVSSPHLPLAGATLTL